MPLQSERLRMIALGSRGDTPPDPAQPALRDGIHLRWAFQRDVGFPWHGFYLFRRDSRRGDPLCMMRALAGMRPGRLPQAELATSAGRFSSDAPLALRDDFPPSPGPEMDLGERGYLAFAFDPARLPRTADVTIGIRRDAPPEGVEIRISAEYQGVEVTHAVVRGKPGQVVGARLWADVMTAIRIPGCPAVLIELCFDPVVYGSAGGWEPLARCPQPLALPVRDPGYPANAGPVDPAAARSAALDRITYGAPNHWAPHFADLHDALLTMVQGGPAAGPMAARALPAQPGAPLDGGMHPPTMPQTSAMDLVLLASLNRAVADMVGLAFVDETAEPAKFYDYLLVADHTGAGGGSAAGVLQEIAANDYANLDGYIVFAKTAAPFDPFAPPQDLRLYALPGATLGQADGGLRDATNNVGLRWRVDVVNGILLPARPVLYHVWRARLGNGTTPGAADFELATPDPVLVAEPILPPGLTPERAADWPPFPLHYLDHALDEGWYGYRVTGIDIFGRHSGRSADGAWWQWAPTPRPRPWYYQDPAADSPLHPSAVRLLDKTPPPPPSGVEAYALDPADPLVLRDAAHAAWWNSLSAAERAQVIGLRVRWRWTQSHMRQAPDTREFRIYYRPGRGNALLCRIVQAVASATESTLTTDVDGPYPADVFAGAFLRIGDQAFPVLGNTAGSPLTLRVGHLGPRVAAGQATVTQGSAAVTGIATAWHAGLQGLRFRMDGGSRVYRVFQVDGPTALRLDEIYAEASQSAQACEIFDLCPGAPAEATVVIPESTAPGSPYIDYRNPLRWQERVYVVSFDDHVHIGVDAQGRPLRTYEVLLPAAGDAYRGGLPLAPGIADPVVYAQIGVTASDNRPHTPDAPVWAAGRHGGRPGNESVMSAPSTVARVHRTPPPAPPPPVDAERVYATPADYHANSYYTVRWAAQAHLRTHVYRALDESVFRLDWQLRPRPALDPGDAGAFPMNDPAWTPATRQQVAAMLNALNQFPHTEAGTAQAMAHYRGLSNNALRILAGLPGVDRAFTQRTLLPLDPADPANADRRGPDSPADYVPDPALRAYTDTLDGRATNRYFYRAAYVDGANNVGPMGLSSAPVWLPNVVPPRACVLTRVLGGDRAITVYWAPNREADLAAYRLYRADSEAAARDLRLMTLVHERAIAPGGVATQPAEQSYVDAPLPGLVTFHYRLVAVDQAGNVSEPSRAVAGRAHDLRQPEPPQPAVAWVDAGAHRRAQISWTAGDETMLQRREPGRSWVELMSWRPPGAYAVRDPYSDPLQSYEYRLWARATTGAVAKGAPVPLAADTPP